MTRPERGRSLRTPKQAALACISAIHCRDISSRCMIFSDAASLPIDRSRADARNRPIPDDNSASPRLDDFPFRTNASRQARCIGCRCSGATVVFAGHSNRRGRERGKPPHRVSLACLARVSRSSGFKAAARMRGDIIRRYDTAPYFAPS